ncbi:MAG: CDP-alcohol phosphatidyltransferase family protein [Bacteroidales bacterium]|nr:CDP-alcohol phosphatidyltransferase family protein [Bacteroidales bacterium]
MEDGKKTTQHETKKFSIQDSLKSQDTEEWLDIHFTRKIGFLWARLAIPLHITPNMITIASIFIGAFGSFLFYYDDLKTNIAGMLLLTLANTFDSADGQLARLTNNKTKLGRILDGLAGDVWFFIIYLVLVLRIINTGEFPTYLVWIVAVLAGSSHIIAAAMADYYRNVHLFFVKGENGSEHDKYSSVKEEFRKINFFKQPFTKISMWFYANYTHQQEILSPKVKQFFETLFSIYPNNIPKDLSEEIREKNKKYMPLTNILQFNTRVIFLFFSLLINKVWLYFCFDIIVMNSILIYLIYKEEQLFGKYDKELKHLNKLKHY